MKSGLYLGSIAAILLLTGTARGEGDEKATYQCDHVIVHYAGISKAYAEAIARTTRAARAIATDRYGFDMPQTFIVHIKVVAPGEHAHLWMNGKDTIYLDLRSAEKLRKPSESGLYNLYGICHEVGHVAMYRLIPHDSWIKDAMAEAWALYIGSRIVDDVYAMEGPDLWPDQYDYREDGTARLKQLLALDDQDNQTTPRVLWAQLGDIVGDKGFAPIFAAWGKVRVDEGDLSDALRKALLEVNPDERLADWWYEAAPRFVHSQEDSDFIPKTLAAPLSGRPVELSYDDGVKGGQLSIGDNGHAVSFAVDGDNYYLTGVKIYGSRYNGAAAPGKDFHVWLCDEDLRPIADFTFPYSSFELDTFKWVDLKVPPINVPRAFIICVAFPSTPDYGIHVGHDETGGEHSLLGLPNADSSPFALLGGDWMIRAIVDAEQSAEPPPVSAAAPPSTLSGE